MELCDLYGLAKEGVVFRLAFFPMEYTWIYRGVHSGVCGVV